MYIFQYIRELSKASAVEDKNVTKKRIIDTNKTGNEIIICNASYLLGQTIRQFVVKDNHWHISKKAYEQLKGLVTQDQLWDYTYDANHAYKDASNVSHKFNKNFTVEHVVPVNKILTKLKEEAKANKLTDDRIMQILDEIHICIITKDEDKLLNHGFRKNREGDYKQIIEKNGAYAICGIEVIDKICFDSNNYLI